MHPLTCSSFGSFALPNFCRQTALPQKEMHGISTFQGESGEPALLTFADLRRRSVFMCPYPFFLYHFYLFFSFRYSYFLFPSVFLSPFVGLIKSVELLSCVFLLYWMSLGLRLGAWGATVLPRLVSCISLYVFCSGRLSL